MNAFLPRDIAIRSIRPVVPEAHARRDALWRTYVYRIVQAKEPLQAGLALHVFKSLDLRTMKRGCALIRGVHDFRSFSKVKTDVNHFVCDVRQATWKRTGTQLAFTITANRFLRGMVRALVGTFLDLGAGEISLKDLHHILQSKDRKMAGANVPPYGLYLMHVQYPRSIFI